jgi:hypothetical protein
LEPYRADFGLAGGHEMMLSGIVSFQWPEKIPCGPYTSLTVVAPPNTFADGVGGDDLSVIPANGLSAQ